MQPVVYMLVLVFVLVPRSISLWSLHKLVSMAVRYHLLSICYTPWFLSCPRCCGAASAILSVLKSLYIETCFLFKTVIKNICVRGRWHRKIDCFVPYRLAVDANECIEVIEFPALFNVCAWYSN